LVIRSLHGMWLKKPRHDEDKQRDEKSNHFFRSPSARSRWRLGAYFLYPEIIARVCSEWLTGLVRIAHAG